MSLFAATSWTNDISTDTHRPLLPGGVPVATDEGR